MPGRRSATGQSNSVAARHRTATHATAPGTATTMISTVRASQGDSVAGSYATNISIVPKEPPADLERPGFSPHSASPLAFSFSLSALAAGSLAAVLENFDTGSSGVANNVETAVALSGALALVLIVVAVTAATRSPSRRTHPRMSVAAIVVALAVLPVSVLLLLTLEAIWPQA
jgi:hypothetical protein